MKVTRIPIEVYRGYPIFKSIEIEVNEWGRVTATYEYVTFAVKGGDFNKKADRMQHYDNTTEKIRSMIDSIEDDGEIVLTETEHNKWVSYPNKCYLWGFTHRRLVSIMNHYKTATPKRKFAYLERLRDANYHTEADLLEDEDYQGYLETIKRIDF